MRGHHFESPKRARGVLCELALLAVCLACSVASAQVPPADDPASSPAAAASPADATPLAEPATDATGDLPTKQSTDTSNGDKPAAARRPLRIGPDTYWLRDAEGNLQPVLNLPYEKLLGALDASTDDSRNSASEAAPRYLIDEFRGTGRIERNLATVNCRYTIRLMTDEAVSIPLGLSSSPLSTMPRYEKPIEALTYDADRGGYVARCQGAPGDKIELVLEALVPLRELEAGTTMRTNLPRAVRSSLVLVSDNRLEQVEATGGLVVETSNVGGVATRIEASGASGDVQLSWRIPETNTTQLESVLSVVGGLRATIDGRSIRTEAKLLVQSYGGSFRQFKVRLPRNAKLESHSEGGLIASVRRDDEGEEAAGALAGEIWRVELSKETEGPIPLSLSTEQPLGLSSDGDDTTIEFAGFEVLGAVRQFGEVAIEVDSNWQLRIDQSANVQQIAIDELADDLNTGRVTAAFEYFRQPWSLELRLLRRDVRVSAEPSYRMQIEPEQIRLRMSIDYVMTGGRIAPLLYQLNGWQVASDPLTATGLEKAQWEVYSDGTAGFPNAEPTAQQVRVVFWLVRDMLPAMLRADDPVVLPLPALVDSDGLTVGTSALTVVAAESIEVTPEAEAMVALVPLPRKFDVAAGADVSAQQFEYRGFANGLQFAATLAERPGQVTVTEDIAVTIAGESHELQHDFAFDVRYQPIESVEIAVPAMAASESLAIELRPVAQSSTAAAAGVPLVYSVLPTADQSESRQLSIALGQLQAGEFVIRLRYSLPRVPAARPTDLPLATPVGLVAKRQQIVLNWQTENAWQLGGQRDGTSAWQPRRDATSRAASDLAYVAEVPQNTVPLVPVVQGSPRLGQTFVDRQWLQTWIGPTQRQQRVVFDLRSDDTSLRVELPRGISARDVEVVVDGTVATNRSQVDEQLEVAISGTGQLVRHTLELRYRTTAAQTSWETSRVEFPRVLGDDSQVDTLWQVVAPRRSIAIAHAAPLAPIYRWGVGPRGWYPLPQLATGELEAWVGASPRRPPADSENQYLFATFGSQLVYSVTLVDIWWLVAATSTAALAVVFALVYVPWLRRATFVVPALVVAAIVGTAYPMLAAIVGYAASLGAALGIVGWLLWLALRRDRKKVITKSTTTGSSLVRRPASENYPLSLGSVVSSNAPTVTLTTGD
jgi:hypothetical protein